MRFAFLSGLLLFITQAFSQCPAGQDSVSIVIVTSNRGYEVYWQLVPDTNACDSATIYSGGNLTQMACGGANANVASPGNGYANYDSITAGPFCLNTGSTYSIRFIDDSGGSDNNFYVMINGLPVYHFHALQNEELFTFVVTPPLAYDMAVKKISTVSYVNPGANDIKGKLFNYSFNTITSLNLNYTIDNTSVITEHLSGLSIAPYTELDFVHSSPWTASPGNYRVSVWADNLNGNSDMNTTNDTITRNISVGPPIPFIIDQYLTTTPSFTLIGDSSDQLFLPSDLDFHTVLSRNELWVINMSDGISYGSTVTFYNAGQPNQVSLWRQDSNADHFMIHPAALAFSDNTNFASSDAILDAHQGSGHFAGPALWSSDSLIYCQPGPGPLGSHIDMLHQSPYAMGIAAETENRFWVYDGYNQRITWYDFVDDHGPGFDEHTDGLVRRYNDIVLSRINDTIPSHLALDNNGLLYIVDNGNARIVRMDTHTGSVTGSFTPYSEYITEHSIVTGVQWSNYITTGLVQPSGIDVIGSRLIVSDYSNGDIIIYDNTGANGTELGRLHTGAPGVAGVKVGPDGKIWFVNQLQNKVYRIDGITVDVASSVPGSLYIYPNPASKIVEVHVPLKNSKCNATLQLFNMNGESVLKKNITGNEFSLNIENLAKGVYLLSVTGDEFNFNKKLVVSE